MFYVHVNDENLFPVNDKQLLVLTLITSLVVVISSLIILDLSRNTKVTKLLMHF